ncbi:MAG: hypothetical protein LBC51_10805 [Treponema sp.]|nr:hypothetical protein [Treponema sp.]
MKKALVGFLILALSAGAFAQESKEQGLKFGGALKTGIQFQTDNTKGRDGTDKYDLYEPSIRMYNDDADAETRLDLDGSFTKDNYGVVFRLRTDTVISGPQVEVHQAYAWADFLGEIINMKVGKIDDSAWNTGGDEDFHYSTGVGLRLEFKPIEGLNVGVFLNSMNQDTYTTAVANGKNGKDARKALDDFILAKEFLLETAFGAKYEHDLFDFAAGLRLDGKGDGLDQGEFFTEEWTTRAPVADEIMLPVDPLGVEEGFIPTGIIIPADEGKDTDLGLGAYAGFSVKAVKNLTAIVEARFNNIPGYNDYGWIWINETLGYAITEQLEAGLVAHQYLFGADTFKDVITLKDDKSISPYLTFKPYVSYALNDKWTVGLDVPVGFWIDIVDYDIGVKPKVSYKLGENASINAFYLFDILQYGDFGLGGDKLDSVMTNTVQIDFIWTF